MPPKKQSIRASLAKGIKKKPKEEKIKQKKQVIAIKTSGKLEAEAKENESVRTFFTNLLGQDDGVKLEPIVSNFGLETNVLYGRKDTINKLLVEVGSNNETIRNFATEFLAQTNDSLKVFLSEYIRNKKNVNNMDIDDEEGVVGEAVAEENEEGSAEEGVTEEVDPKLTEFSQKLRALNKKTAGRNITTEEKEEKEKILRKRERYIERKRVDKINKWKANHPNQTYIEQIEILKDRYDPQKIQQQKLEKGPYKKIPDDERSLLDLRKNIRERSNENKQELTIINSKIQQQEASLYILKQKRLKILRKNNKKNLAKIDTQISDMEKNILAPLYDERSDLIQITGEGFEGTVHDKTVLLQQDIPDLSTKRFPPDTTEYNISRDKLAEIKREIMKKDVKSTKLEPNIDIDCIAMYKTVPWIGSKIGTVYISGDLSYATTNQTIPYMGKEWAPANKEFFKLQCNRFSKLRRQTGDVLTLYQYNNGSRVEVNVSVLYTKKKYESDANNLLTGSIIQNEQIFKDEKEWLHNLRETRQEFVNRILREPVSTLTKQYAAQNLRNELIAGSNNTSKPSKSYINQIIDNLANKYDTTQQFLEALGEIIVYISFSKYDIFRERLKNEYYLPNIISELTQKDKLPEIYHHSGITEDQQNRVSSLINIKLTTFVNSSVDDIYRLGESKQGLRTITTGSNVNDEPEIPYINDIKVIEWKNRCVNSDDVKSIPNKDLVFYKEKGTTYCFVIQLLSDRFSKKDFTNPISGKKLSTSFINTFQRTYSSEIINITQDISSQEQKPEKAWESFEKLAPGLLDKIIESLNETDEGAQAELGLENTNNDSDDDDQSSSSTSTSSSDSDSPSSSPSKPSSSFAFTSGDHCSNCNKPTDPKTALKTQIVLKPGKTPVTSSFNNEGETSAVYFCPFPAKCLETYEFKSSKSRKSKKS